MSMITTKESIEIYKEFESKFISPYSTIRESIKVQLYKEIRLTRLGENIKKKPLIVFYFSADGIDIPKKDWTYEMKQSAKQYTLDYPVTNAGKKYSLLGKVLFSVSAIGVLFASVIICYLALF